MISLLVGCLFVLHVIPLFSPANADALAPASVFAVSLGVPTLMLLLQLGIVENDAASPASLSSSTLLLQLLSLGVPTLVMLLLQLLSLLSLLSWRKNFAALRHHQPVSLRQHSCSSFCLWECRRW